jgi:hypothetical protein
MKIVWRRELIRFKSDRMRIVTVADPAAAVPVRARLRPAAAVGGEHRTAST